MKLPDYCPPDARRANLAVGLSPIIVLVVFTLIVTQLIEVDTGLAIMGACTVWVVYEMHDYQRAIDEYNEEYVESHLLPRSSATLQSMVSTDPVHAPTRHFVLRFLDAGRVLLRDGQSH